MPARAESRDLIGAAAASGGALVLWEILITRVFSVVLFADLAHLALAVAMLGITLGAAAVALRPAPDDVALRRRLGRLLLAQAVASVAVTAAALWLPLTDEASPLVSWYERDRVRFDLLQPAPFALLVAILPAPAVASGAALGTIFLRPAVVARAYAADLAAASLAALAFVPLCQHIAPPDLAILSALLCLLGAARLADRRLVIGGALLTTVALLVSTQRPVLELRHAAGWAEQHVLRAVWTPTARLAVFSGPSDRGVGGDYLLLDNGSASLIVTEPAQVTELAGFVSRGLVHTLHPEPGRVAVLAAGAGPEAAVALAAGHAEVLAVDLDEKMFSLVREHAPEPPNPLVDGRVTTIAMDARAALEQQVEPLDIIQLVHPNLTTATGLLNSAWSPRLLYTREAIGTYLDHLDKDGTLSITAPELAELHETVRAALAARGATNPDDHIAAVVTARRDQVLLVKPRPLTAAERGTLDAWIATEGLRPRTIRPVPARVLTDDRPYTDRLADLLPRQGPPGGAAPLVYRTMLWSLAVMAGVFTVVLGLVLRARPGGLRLGRAAVAPLLLASCLGYGYLAVEVVLIHRLVPLVGHPVYALTTVLVAMLAGSAAGSAAADRLSGSRLPAVLCAVPLLGATTAVLLPPLGASILSGSVLARSLAVGAALLPLAAAAGMAMPLALRSVGGRQPRLAALMWAANGWASVLAATVAVMIARFSGYSASLALALLLYAAAAAIVWKTPALR